MYGTRLPARAIDDGSLNQGRVAEIAWPGGNLLGPIPWGLGVEVTSLGFSDEASGSLVVPQRCRSTHNSTTSTSRFSFMSSSTSSSDLVLFYLPTALDEVRAVHVDDPRGRLATLPPPPRGWAGRCGAARLVARDGETTAVDLLLAIQVGGASVLLVGREALWVVVDVVVGGNYVPRVLSHALSITTLTTTSITAVGTLPPTHIQVPTSNTNGDLVSIRTLDEAHRLFAWARTSLDDVDDSADIAWRSRVVDVHDPTMMSVEGSDQVEGNKDRDGGNGSGGGGSMSNSLPVMSRMWWIRALAALPDGAILVVRSDGDAILIPPKEDPDSDQNSTPRWRRREWLTTVGPPPLLGDLIGPDSASTPTSSPASPTNATTVY